MHKQLIPIDSKLNNLKSGDKIFNVEFEMGDNPDFIFRELEFKRYIEKTIHIEGLETNENSIIAELRDPKFEKIEMKTDISCGFFLSKKEAVDEFVESIKLLYEKVKIKQEQRRKMNKCYCLEILCKNAERVYTHPAFLTIFYVKLLILILIRITKALPGI